MPPLRLFEGFGVEIEYMIVDENLDVFPCCDRLLHALAGEPTGEVDLGAISVSNELALHVVELKTNGPAASLAGLADQFHLVVRQLNALLAPMGGRLMPTAMHPWMDPLTQTRLWPGEYNETYETFNRIFDCRGHGWSNVQSTHLNLPFGNEDEFGRLHAAIRVLLPLMPALAASSPIVAGRVTGLHDTRLEYYRHNCRRVPSVTGRVIPEPVFDPQQYDEQILRTMYREISPLDPAGVLQHEWLNARGAIARFERSAIEIRVLDVQECPSADLAIVSLIVEVLRELVEERWSSYEEQRSWPTEALEAIFLQCIAAGSDARVDDRSYLGLLGLADLPARLGSLCPSGRADSRGGFSHGPTRARDVWSALKENLVGAESGADSGARAGSGADPLAGDAGCASAGDATRDAGCGGGSDAESSAASDAESGAAGGSVLRDLNRHGFGSHGRGLRPLPTLSARILASPDCQRGVTDGFSPRRAGLSRVYSELCGHLQRNTRAP